MEIQVLGEPVQFIAVGHAGHVQRGLVQRAEQDGIRAAGGGQAQRHLQGVQAVAAAHHAGLAARKRPFGGTAEVVEQRDLVGEFQLVQGGHRPVGKLATGYLHALAHFRLVGDQQHPGPAAHFGLGQQPGDQLRADAGGVAQDHGDSGKAGIAHAVVLMSVAPCGSRRAEGWVR
ncbi:hypothetical protein D3C72_1741120 [compost metagenome]